MFKEPRCTPAVTCTLLCLLTCAALPKAQAASVTIGTIPVEFDGSGQNTTLLHFTDTGTRPLNDVSHSVQGYRAAALLTGTTSLNSTPSGTTLDFTFTDSRSVFPVDFDDDHGKDAPYTSVSSYDGTSMTATFSPDPDASGGLIGFLDDDEIWDWFDPVDSKPPAYVTILITYDLVAQVVSLSEAQGNIADALNAKLHTAQVAEAHGNLNAKAGALKAFANLVAGQKGKSLTAEQAACLNRLVGLL